MEAQQSKKTGILMTAVTYGIASIAAVWNTVMRDGTIEAIAREAIKDIRNTNHEVFFGQGENFSEPGTPLSPTQGEIAADRKCRCTDCVRRGAIAYGRGDMHGQHDAHDHAPLRSPSEIAADRGGSNGPEQGNDYGHEHGRELEREM